MTMKQGALLLASHVFFAGMGWWIVGTGPVEDACRVPGPNETRPDSRRTVRVSEENPIFRASSADFRAAWRQLLEEPRPDLGMPLYCTTIFFDWCRVDPEGALLGLQEFYSPRRARSILSNAVQAYGADLAEPLARHWEGFRFIEGYRISNYLGTCMNAVSKEDPARATGLVEGLPPEVRRDLYGEWFDSLPLEALDDLATRAETSLLTKADASEKNSYWQSMAQAVNSVGQSRAAIDWLGRVRPREGVETFAVMAMDNAGQNGHWTEFIDTVARLDAPRSQWARTAVLKQIDRIRDPEAKDMVRRELSGE